MNKYTYSEAFELSKQYFGNDYSAAVYVDKYALRDNSGSILEPTPDYLHDRLAKEFARIDSEKYKLNYDDRYAIYRGAINKFSRIVPQGSPMAAIGNPYQLMSASNCVVIASPRDSMAGIVESGQELAQLMKRRCGVGIDISTLRPEGARVNNAARTTSGAWSFADFFSYVTRMVGQQGRRGALMITMSVHHPDVVQFATSKHDETKVTGANISVRLSNEFLKAVEADEEYEQRWPIEGVPTVVKKVRAREVWDIIVKSATETADPGLIMWDNMIENLPAHCYEQFKTISTNPCSEIALSAYDSCRLISINLTGYVKNAFEDSSSFDFDSFKSDVRIAMQMADNLVDLEIELIEKIKGVCEEGTEKILWNKLLKAGSDGRRTGLGTHGLGDALAQLKIKYDTQEAIDVVDKIYEALRDTAYETSCDLAEIRGSFPVFDYEKEVDCSFIKRLPDHIKQKMKSAGRRNISLLTQAPTGSVATLSKIGSFDSFNVSSGVEPVFRNFYTRRKKINANEHNARVDFTDKVGDKWQEYKIFHSNVQNYINKFALAEDVELPDFFVTSDQVDWMKRIELQGKEQTYLDHSISSTINLPEGTPSSVVSDIYINAWKHGLKGITVYVEGSKDGVLISNKKIKRPAKIVPATAPKRPLELPCDIHHSTLKGKKWIVLVGLMNDEPYEVFTGYASDMSVPTKYDSGKIVKIRKGKYDLHAITEDDQSIVGDILSSFDDPDTAWATRMISASLRHGVSIDFIVELLGKDGGIGDANKVISRCLKKYIKEGAKVRTSITCENLKPDGDICGSTDLVYSEGCVKCMSCGWSKCN